MTVNANRMLIHWPSGWKRYVSPEGMCEGAASCRSGGVSGNQQIKHYHEICTGWKREDKINFISSRAFYKQTILDEGYWATHSCIDEWYEDMCNAQWWYPWLRAILQYLHCWRTVATAVLHQTNGMILIIFQIRLHKYEIKMHVLQLLRVGQCHIKHMICNDTWWRHQMEIFSA